MIYDISKVRDTFYIYALLPNKERNYTLIIKDAHYYELGEEKKQDLSFDFEVKGNITEFSVNPGFIVTNNDFNIKVESKYKDLTLETEFLNSTEQVSVPAYKTKTLSFSVEDVNVFTTTTLKIASQETQYEIPISIIKFGEEENITEEDIETSEELKFAKSHYNLTAFKDSEIVYVIRLSNTGQEDIEDITLTLEDLESVSFVPENIDIIEAGEQAKINLTILSPELGIKEGTFRAEIEDLTVDTLISIETLERDEKFTGEIYKEQTCADMGGVFCESDEKCVGKPKLSSDYTDTLCCIGTCEKKETGFGASKIIALIVIIVLLAGIGFYVFRKLRKKPKTPKQLLREKEESFQERFKQTEVRGSLER
jgi:hypothetical protein